MRTAICQINPIIGDFKYNTSLILEGSDRARESGCALAVFPELSLLGYPPKDLLERPSFVKEKAFGYGRRYPIARSKEPY